MRPRPPRSCRCPRRARPRAGARPRTRALTGDLQRDPRGEQREPHVGSVQRTCPTGLPDQERQLLVSLATLDDGEGAPHRGARRRRRRRAPPTAERHGEARGLAPAVPVREPRQSGRPRPAPAGRAPTTPSGAQYITEPFPALTSGPRRSKTARAGSGVRSTPRNAARVWFPHPAVRTRAMPGGASGRHPDGGHRPARSATSTGSAPSRCRRSTCPAADPSTRAGTPAADARFAVRRRNSNGAPSASPS